MLLTSAADARRRHRPACRPDRPRPLLPAPRRPAGVFATAAAGALLLPSLFQLVLIGGGLWLGATAAQALLGFGGGGGGADQGFTVGPNGERLASPACPRAVRLYGCLWR